MEHELTNLPSVALHEHDQLPECPGVYFVFSDPENVLYIGISRNMRKRWSHHHRYEQLSRRPMSRIHFIAGDQDFADEALASLERYYIQKYNPLLNDTSMQKAYEFELMDIKTLLGDWPSLYFTIPLAVLERMPIAWQYQFSEVIALLYEEDDSFWPTDTTRYCTMLLEHNLDNANGTESWSCVPDPLTGNVLDFQSLEVSPKG